MIMMSKKGHNNLLHEHTQKIGIAFCSALSPLELGLELGVPIDQGQKKKFIWNSSQYWETQ
jgi:hypothetical protein